MKTRTSLTAIWLVSFAISVTLILSYLRTEHNGMRILFTSDLGPTLRPLCVLYGSYLAGILGFWFFKPFKLPADRGHIRFYLAVSCTLLLNAPIIWFLLQWHLAGEGRSESVQTDVESAISWAKWASFLVAPINLYYFGMKSARA